MAKQHQGTLMQASHTNHDQDPTIICRQQFEHHAYTHDHSLARLVDHHYKIRSQERSGILT
jgi:hypothetical protein